SYLRRSLTTMLSLHGPGHFDVAYSRVSLGLLLHEKGERDAAESEFRQALAVYDKTLPRVHQWRASALMYYAQLVAEEGRTEEAQHLAKQAVDIWTATSPAGSIKTAQAHAIYGFTLLQAGQAAAALAEIEPTLPALEQGRGAQDAFVVAARGWRDTAQAQKNRRVARDRTVSATAD
ncbi:MAG: tetratricopeptide repeat protein, partial [Proteobacteria bacterium]|nr:tetratricopeptide repeat protein [Pseudomonadota bacterium]